MNRRFFIHGLRVRGERESEEGLKSRKTLGVVARRLRSRKPVPFLFFGKGGSEDFRFATRPKGKHRRKPRRARFGDLLRGFQRPRSLPFLVLGSEGLPKPEK